MQQSAKALRRRAMHGCDVFHNLGLSFQRPERVLAMTQIGFGEFLVILLIVLVFYGIPISLAAFVIIALKRIRSDHELFRKKLDAIERLLLNRN